MINLFPSASARASARASASVGVNVGASVGAGVKVKVCGITRLQDAELAIELGAQALGFVMASSPRQISAEQANIISKRVPKGIHRVGVFVNPSFEYLREVVLHAGLSGVQLHGQESSAFVSKVREEFPELYLIKALAVTQASEAEGMACDAILIDPPRLDDRELSHGPLPRELKEKFLYVAGGLTAENVARFIQSHSPQGVDVSRGVEASPGIKDAAMMKEFFAQVNSSLIRSSQ